MSRPSFELMEVVRAGAGAGKTTQLTNRVIEVAEDYLKTHGTWPKLVVTTFTKKATQELRERLITQACQMKRWDLLDYVSSPARLHISTLHGIFSHFLRNYAHLLGWDSQFVVITEKQSHQLAKKTLRQIIFSEEATEFSSLIELYGFERVTELLLRLLKLKTEFPDLGICCEPDFKKVMESKAHIYAKQLSSILREMDNFNSPSWMAYKSHLHKISQLLGSGDIVKALRLFEGLSRKPRRPKEACEETDCQFKEILKDLKSWLAKPSHNPSSWSVFVNLSTQLDKLFHLFKKDFEMLKRKTGQFEISDLELLTYQITKRESKLAEYFSREWNYWFVDEYQDTSPLQVEILNKLMGDSSSFIVGDPQQSIYLFRGARSEVFHLKQEETLKRGGKLKVLDKNYRSRPELLYFFNDFFSDISPNFQPMQPRDNEGVCQNQVIATYSVADPDEQRGRNENIAIYNHIHNLLDKGEKYEDICVLARTHNHLNEVASFLRGLPTHIHTSSGFHERREVLDALALLKFTINPHDNFNVINILRSPWCHLDDYLIVAALSNSASSSKVISHWRILSSAYNGHRNIQWLHKVLQKTTEIGVSEAFKWALKDCGLFDLARKHDPSGRWESNLWKLVTQLEIEERRSGFNYLKFINSLSRGEWEDGGDAVACLEPNRINLMTIHASKGLKFKNVILPRMDRKPILTTSSSRKPLINVDEEIQKWTLAVPLGDEKKMSHSPVALAIFEKLSEREREESDRLLYVALTRAEETVFLSWVQGVQGVQGVQKGSWVEKIHVPPEEGIVTRKNYSLKIQRGCWEKRASATRSSMEKPRKLRAPYGKISQTVEKHSISELLEEDKQSKEGLHFIKSMKSSSDGVLVHRMMESLRYGENIDYKSWSEEWFGQRSEEIMEAINFVKNLKTPPMKQLLKSGFVEWGFQIKADGRIIEGQIDLWGEVENPDGKKEAWLIDYKSGSDKYIDKAFKQLDFYSQALRKHGVSCEIKQAVIYPLNGAVEMR